MTTCYLKETDVETPVVALTVGVFLFNVTSESTRFSVYLELGRYKRSDGGPISTIYGTCGACQWPRLSLTYVLSDDADVIASKYAELEALGKAYECPACGSGHIQPPTESGDTFRCGHCGQVLELANVRGSAMSEAYCQYLRAKWAENDDCNMPQRRQKRGRR